MEQAVIEFDQGQALKISDILDHEETRDDFLKRVREEVATLEPDVSTDKGRKAIASMAHKVAKTKVAVDNAAKDLTADLRAKVDGINASRKSIREELDELKVEVRKPLTEWEEAEAERERQANAQVLRINELSSIPHEATAEEISSRIHQVEAIQLTAEVHGDDLERVEGNRDGALARMRDSLDAQTQREAEQAELERLRKEAEERKAKEAEEAAERARIEAEETAKREEAERIEKARQEAAEQAKREAEEKLEQERRDRELAEVRQKEAQEAAARAEEERIAAAKAAAEREAEADRQRQEEAEAARIHIKEAEEARVKAEREAEAAKAEAEAKPKAESGEPRRSDLEVMSLARNELKDRLGVSHAAATDFVRALKKGEVEGLKLDF